MQNTENGLETFVMDMKVTLYRHQKEKGDSWADCDLQFLLDKFEEEIKEFKDEVKPSKKAKELVDVANICMMLYHRYINIWAEQASKIMKS